MKTLTKIAITTFLSLGLVGSAFADHREFRGERHRDHGSDAGWFLGGLVLGAIIVDANRPQEYVPPYRSIHECRDYIIIEYNGYEHMERRCRTVEVPVE